MSELRRARSMQSIPSYAPQGYTYGTNTSYRVSTSPSLQSIRRVTSLPELYPPVTSSTYRYSPTYSPVLYQSYRDWDLADNYWTDRRYYTSNRFWPYYGKPYSSLYGTSLDYNYPYSYYSYSFNRPSYNSSYYDYDRPRYMSRYYADYFDSFYWRRRSEPSWSRPWSYYSWSSPASRPLAYESQETERAWDMYRKGMIGYETFDRYYLSPSTWQSRYSDQLKPYQAPIGYSSYPHSIYRSNYR